MISFYMDEHVPKAITNGLRLRNIDVVTVQEDGRTGITDNLVLDRAIELQRILFTQDDDFLVEVQKRQQLGLIFSGVIYAHQLAISIGRCINDLELITQIVTLEELAGAVQYLPL
jgi:predicted nuclease of predicted toxin-antitoxin system